MVLKINTEKSPLVQLSTAEENNRFIGKKSCRSHITKLKNLLQNGTLFRKLLMVDDFLEVVFVSAAVEDECKPWSVLM